MDMRRQIIPVMTIFFLLLIILTGSALLATQPVSPPPDAGGKIVLPPPSLAGPLSVEEALYTRRSVRTYSTAPLTLAEVGQLLWAAQGITHPAGYRTAASAGGLYPLEVLVVVGHVDDLDAGIYRYHPHGHALSLVALGDYREALSEAALGQLAVAEGAVVLVLAGVYERTAARYGERGRQYVHMEVGIASQNVHLQAVSLGLGAVFIGAFYEEQLQPLLHLAEEERPLCLMPVGRLPAVQP